MPNYITGCNEAQSKSLPKALGELRTDLYKFQLLLLTVITMNITSYSQLTKTKTSLAVF